jgi:hypothetical protein
MPSLSAAELAQWGRIGAHTRWSQTEDRTAATEPARRALLKKFEREVDPNNELTDAERFKRAEHARKAYYARLALKSVKARRLRSDRKSVVDARITELDGGDTA